MTIGIDAGKTLIYKSNYPIPGINQSSQQFRDNFAIIKSAVEDLQSKIINISGDVSGLSLPIDSGLTPISLNLTFSPNPIFTGSQRLRLPKGSSSERPSGAVSGDIRFNTDTLSLECFDGISWNTLGFSTISTIIANSADPALRITQTGSGDALLVEDSANPDSSPFVITSSGNVGIGTDSPSTKLDVIGSIIVNENISVRGDFSTAGNIRLYENLNQGDSYVLIKSPESLSQNIIWTLPSSNGSAGQLLTTDGNGNLSWTSTSTTTVINDTSTSATFYPVMTNYTSGSLSSVYVSNTKLNFNPSTGNLLTGGTITGSGSIIVNGTNLNSADIKLYEDTDNGNNYVSLKAPSSLSSNIIWTFPSADGTNGQVLSTDGSGNLTWISPSFTGSLIVQGTNISGADIKLYEDTDNGTNYASLKAPDSLPSNVTWTLPTSDGTNGQILVTDGSGNLGWGNLTSPDPNFDLPVIISINSSSNALRITQTGTGNALVVEDSTNPDLTPFVIDSSGKVILGHTEWNTNWYSSSNIPQFMAVTNSSNRGGFGSINYAGPAGLSLFRAGGGVIGTQGIVSNNDILGSITFAGYDGGTLEGKNSAQIIAVVDGAPSSGNLPGRLVFQTTPTGSISPVERMRIDNQGRIGIDGSADSEVKFKIGGTLPISSNSAYAARIWSTVPSSVTNFACGIQTLLKTDTASFTLSNFTHFIASENSIGAGSSVNNQYGFFAESNLIGATNNFGFYSNIPSGSGRWNFYSGGSANNYFSGNVGIGITTPTAALNVVTNSSSDAVRITQTGSGNALVVEDSSNPDSTPFVIDNNGQVGIGNTTPSAKLHILGNLQTGGIYLEALDNTSGSPSLKIIGKRSDGNTSSTFSGKILLAGNHTSGVVGNNKTLGSIHFGGNHTDSSIDNISYSASVIGIAEGSFNSSTDMPTGLAFLTGNVGYNPDTANISIGTERLRITSTGNVGIGTNSPVSKLDVTGIITSTETISVRGSSSTGADIRLHEDTDNGTNYVAFRAPASITSNITWTLPSSDGILGQALITNGGGSLSWTTIPTTGTADGNVPVYASGTINMEDKILQRPVLKDIGETKQTIAAAATTNINVENGNVVELTQNTNITSFTFSNPPASGTFGGLTIIRVKDNTITSRSIVWPSSVDWPGGTAPTLTQTANAVDIFVFFTFDGGTRWFGSMAGKDVK